jgi:hypothetical protein
MNMPSRSNLTFYFLDNIEIFYLTKSENETNKIGEREREYLGGIDETLTPPIKEAVAEVDGDVALKLHT